MLHEILKMLLEEKIILKGFTFIDSFFDFADLLESEILKIFSKRYEQATTTTTILLIER